jgi:hypothetical protein
MYAGLRWSLGPQPIGGRTCLHGAWNSYAQHVPIGYRLLGRYLDKAYISVPGGVGSNPPHTTFAYARFNRLWAHTWIRRTAPFREAWVLTPLMPLPYMHGLTCYVLSAFTAGFTRATGRSSWDDVH